MRFAIVSMTLVVVSLVGCGKDAKETSARTQGSATSTRPAAITQEMNTTFEAYVVAFEKLTAELAAVATDCSKAPAVIERNAKALDALETRGAALTAQMVKLDEPAAGEWFGATYGPRLKIATETMNPFVKSCDGDPAIKTGMNDLMARFPMMRKKPGAAAAADCSKYADMEIKCDESTGEGARPTIIAFCEQARGGATDVMSQMLALEIQCAATISDCAAYKTCVENAKAETVPQ